MIQRRWELITAVAAIATAVLMVAALATWGNHYYTDPVHKITSYYVANQHKALLSQFLFLLFGLSVLTFGVGLRPVLHRAEGEPHALSALFFAGSVAVLLWMMVFAAINGGLAAVAGGASPSEIRLIMGIEGYVDQLSFLAIGIMVGSAGLAMTVGHVFARWIGWLGVASGILYLTSNVAVLDPNPNGTLAGISNLGMIGSLLFLIWLIALGVRLLRRPATDRTPAAVAGTEAVPA